MVAVEIRTPHTKLIGRRSPRGDAMAILEAAYDLNSDDVEWLTGVARAMHPFLDRGLGTHSFLYRLSQPQCALEVHTVVFMNAPARLREVLAASTNLVKPEEIAAFYEGPPCLTVSQRYARFVSGRSYDAFAPARLLDRELGIADQLGVLAVETDVAGCVFMAPVKRTQRFPPRSAGILSRVARHLGAARRLRGALKRSLKSVASLEVDAVLGEDGAVLHAEAEATHPSELDALSSAAKTLGETRKRLRRSDPEEAVRLWRALVQGKWSLIDTRDSDGKRLLVARRNAPGFDDPAALKPGERQVVALAARGHSLKLIAYELGLAEPTVSTRLTRGLQKLGLGSRAELARCLRFDARKPPLESGER
jgi:DNA-binding CsgD family transcriptional regulator